MELSIIQVRITAKVTDILRLDKALAAAEKIAGNEGYIMTAPDFIDARLSVPLDDPLWQDWFTCLSGEYHGKDKQGNNLYAVAHGKGPFTKSRRLKRAIEDPEMLPYGYARISDREFAQVVKDAVPLEEIKGKNPKLSDSSTLVGRVDQMKINPSGIVSLDDLRNDDRFLMAVGSEERRHAYLDKMKKEFQWDSYGNWYWRGAVNYTISQGRLLFLGYGYYSGLNGDYNLYYFGRFVGVRERSEQLAPKAQRVRSARIG